MSDAVNDEPAAPAVEKAAGHASKIDASDFVTPKNVKAAFWAYIKLYSDHAKRAKAGEPDAYCFKCSKPLRYNGTGNLGAHAKTVHKDDEKANSSIVDFMTDKRVFFWMCIRWIINDYQAIRVVESKAFRAMIRSLSKTVSIPSRADVVEALDQLELLARAGVLELTAGQHPALTTDAWSSSAMDAFICVTLDFFTEDWEKVHLPLECSPMPGSHTGEALNNKVLQMLDRAGVKYEMVSALVADNAANQKLAGELSPFDSLPCVAHTLQLTAKVVLDSPRTARVLKIYRKIVGSFKHSGLKLQDLYSWQQQAGLPKKKPRQDVKTRWYYTFLCVQWAIENKQPLQMAMVKYGDPNPPARVPITRHQSGATTGKAEALAAAAAADSEEESADGYTSSDDGSVAEAEDLEAVAAVTSDAAPAAATSDAAAPQSGSDTEEADLSSGSELEYGSAASGTHNKHKLKRKQKASANAKRTGKGKAGKKQKTLSKGM